MKKIVIEIPDWLYFVIYLLACSAFGALVGVTFGWFLSEII